MSDQIVELAIGSQAPEFRLASSTGGEIGLADYRGKTNVVLFFARAYI